MPGAIEQPACYPWNGQRIAFDHLRVNYDWVFACKVVFVNDFAGEWWSLQAFIEFACMYDVGLFTELLQGMAEVVQAAYSG
ncbi:hypothetical protein BJN45_04315 [Azonexus hydrophilus]|uniref:Uncharacterized protein n=1 Tax=Azonexus hydrophilus TaxID=418702 RepID=A0A1R1IDU5_9RHOO|nr:hypothetical protein BJN45_04315 [Azonexus hydrophilus]